MALEGVFLKPTRIISGISAKVPGERPWGESWNSKREFQLGEFAIMVHH